MRYVLAIVAMALGVAGMAHGEAEESPGLRLLGAALAIGAIAFGVRVIRGGR
ncbi:hypothetical protein [Micromonospora sp. NPDC003776]